MPTKRKAAEAESGGEEDRLSDLPDDLLRQVLSFLPAHEVVRSCVLSRRWRNLWRSVPVLRIRREDAREWYGPERFNEFVNNLLLLRDPSPLHELEFCTYLYHSIMAKYEDNDINESLRYVEPWIQYALNCNVRVLRVVARLSDEHLLLVRVPLISEHLTTLQLRCVLLDNRSLDFSRCPALEVLEMERCRISTDSKILSPSVKRICVTSCDLTHDWLSSLPALEDLEMKPCSISTDSIILPPSLKRLFITYCDITHDWLSSLPALEVLEMEYCKICVHSMLSPSLKRLCLRSCGLPHDWLSGLPALKDLEVDFCNIPTDNMLSRSLKRLCLTSCDLTHDWLSSLPALEDLEMKHCKIRVHNMVSQSLKRLCITACFLPSDSRTQIFTPGLVSLLLSHNWGKSPLLESMPLLVAASVNLWIFDRSYCDGSMDCSSDTCVGCYGDLLDSGKCVLLGGLSNATTLKLAATGRGGYGPFRNPHYQCIFKLELAYCPTFSKLKTLLLIGWVSGHDFPAVFRFLQHTPILEKLILQIFEGHEHMAEMEQSTSSVEQLVQHEHLKVVEVRCLKIDEWVHRISTILKTYGISLDKISIQIQTNKGWQPCTLSRRRTNVTLDPKEWTK